MNRISVLAVTCAIGTAALTAGCSSSASNGPAPTGSQGSTTSVGSATTPSSESTSNSSMTNSSASSSSASGSTSSASKPSAPASTPAVAPTHAAGSKCTATEMPAGTWKPIEGGNGAGHTSADIAFQNTSTHSCTVSGYPAVSLLASDQHPLPTNVIHFPTGVTTVTVAPGAWIHSEIRYSPNVPGPGEPTTGNCEPETVHANAQLPGDTKWVPVTLATPTTVCEKGTLEAKPFASGQSTPAGG